MEKIRLIANRIIEDSSPLFGSVKMSIFLSVGCFIIIQILISNSLIHPYEITAWDRILNQIWVLTVFSAFLIVPLIISIYAIALLNNKITNESYKLVILSNISFEEFTLGFVAAILYRLHGFLTLILGLALVISIHSLIRMYTSMLCLGSNCAPSNEDVVLFVVIAGILLTGLYLFSAVWSTFIVLRFRYANFLKILTILIGTIIVAVLSLVAAYWTNIRSPAQVFLFAIGSSIPFILSIGIIAISKRQIVRFQN